MDKAEQASMSVVIGPQAPELERFAAEELCAYLEKLFGIQARPETRPSPSAQAFFLVGSPGTNPAAEQAVPSEASRPLSEQGIALDRMQFQGTPALLVRGGSPRATLWAVYELAERWGVRHLLHGDIFPQRQPFHVPEVNLVLEPTLAVRQWRVINDFACGPESWGMADYRPVLDQLAKLKFNRIFLSVWPYQPFLHLEVRGIKRRCAWLWYDYHYPITEDMVGRHLFGQAREFWNPDLPVRASYEELAAAGERLVHSLMDYAHRRGMKCVMAAWPTEFPPEFAPLLKGAQKVHQLGEMTIVPSAESDVDDPALTELAAAVLRATADTYPEADYVALGMPEFRQWAGQYERAWRALDARYGLEKVCPLTEALAAAQQRSSYPGGAERAVQEVKGDIVALYFYDRLLRDLEVLKDTRRPDMKFVYNSVAEELFPILGHLLPSGSETLNFVDYTASRVVRRREALKNVPSRKIPCSLIYTLHDDNVGLLPQLTTGSLYELTTDLRRYGWAGFSTRYWLIGDHDPCLAYLSKAAWDTSATPEAIYRDQIRAACEEACVEDMLKVFREVEATTLALESHGLGLGFPVPGMIMKHWRPGPMPVELAEDRRGYQRGLEAARQALTKATPEGRSTVDYWIGRLEFGIGYLDTIETVRAAATAESEDKFDEALRHAEAALAAARRCLEAYARIARDQSDRGAIAVMNEYVYRPLKAKVAEIQCHFLPQVPNYSKYPAGLAGYTGLNLNEIACWSRKPAIRSRVGWRGLYKTGLAALPNGDLLASPSYRASDGKMHLTIFRSRDEGRTWTHVRTKGDELLGQENALICLRTGSVMLLNGAGILLSDDEGVTWKLVQRLDGFEMVRNVIQAPDLTLLLTKGTYYPLSHPAAPPCQGWLFYSTDGGRSWFQGEEVKMWNSPESMFPEAAVVRLRDGHLLAAGRVSGDHPIRDIPPPRGLPTPKWDESGDHLILAESLDGGKTWSDPRAFLNYSEVHAHLLPLQDGRLLCSYASYHLPYGIFAVLSEDEGKTWDTDLPIQLALSMNVYTGWPTSLQLPNGDILTAYAITAYLEGEGVSLMNRGRGDTVAEVVRWSLP